jgi:hypothetical protein
MRKAFVSILAGLTLGAVLTGGAFAQARENTVIVDIGPTIFGLAMAGALDGMLSDAAEDANEDSDAGASGGSSGFGIAVQYERQITKKFSVAGRFAYVGLGLGMSMSTDDAEAKIEGKISSISIDAHGRYYPAGRTFFLDGALGYANMTTSVSGKYREYDFVNGRKVLVNEEEPISFAAPRNFFKFGAKLGWRLAFGDAIKFVFEPALGYDVGIGGGDLIGTKFQKWARDNDADVFSDDDVKSLDDAWKILESVVFVGGPRISLSFGCSF